MVRITLLISLCIFTSTCWSYCTGSCSNGNGDYTWPDGIKYVGEFSNWLQNGQGTQTWPDGRKYVGGFKDGHADGKGTYTWPDGTEYFGTFSDGKTTGQGTYTWPDGSKYVGGVIDWIKNGLGVHTWPDGRRFVGEFSGGTSREGTEYLTDGRQLVFGTDGTNLQAANGQLLKASVPDNELDAIRATSAKNKKITEQKLAREKQLLDAQLAEQSQRIQNQIFAIQQLLIVGQYLRGAADGIVGKGTLSALKVFYQDTNLPLPAFDDYVAINEDLDSTLLMPVGNCANDSTEPSAFSICFTFELD